MEEAEGGTTSDSITEVKKKDFFIKSDTGQKLVKREASLSFSICLKYPTFSFSIPMSESP